MSANDRDKLRREFFEPLKPAPNAEELWANLIQQKIPDNQKLAFQQLVRELVEERKTVHKLWKYVVLFILIGVVAAVIVYFLTCWAEYLEIVENKYVIREEIYASDAPVCLGVSVRRFGEPPSRMIETIARLVTIISLVMLAKGVRLAWKIWHVSQTTVDPEELQNNPIKVLSQTLQKDFLGSLADSGLAF
ncbi:hypothetical protein OESDEN_06874 [Oesophagostomum dentatum]|uniref:Uncharacterized protein n=2 Tax=Oesophagostomum dentatum TaxID=61180 RepID=A0A0B1TBM7_OESDE|nr:hypothetical protein OESDEN_06874 [Oesophagostomum dentatum]